MTGPRWERYPCQGRMFVDQQAADVAQDIRTVATRERHEVYLCVDGHWHVRKADR